MSLSGAKEDPEDKTGGSFPAVNQCVGNSVQNVTLELLLPETSWLLSATMQMRWKESIFHWRSVAYVSLGRFIFNWKLISHKTIFWVSAMQWVFLSRPPHKPHPSPSALRGLLPAQEAELEVKRTGPGPSVSPWLQGSDYVHGKLNPTHDTHSRENTEPATATEAPPGLMSNISLKGEGDGGLLTSQPWFVAISLQNWSCHPRCLWKAEAFFSCEPAGSVWKVLWRQINNVKCSTINMIESILISPLWVYLIDFLPRFSFKWYQSLFY